MGKGMGQFKHLKSQDSNETRFAILEGQLLTLYKSAVYFTNHDFVTIGEKLGIKLPYKNRDLILKMLLQEAEKSDKSNQLLEELLQILHSRKESYINLGNNFTRLIPTIKVWLQKINTMELLIKQQTRMNPYG